MRNINYLVNLGLWETQVVKRNNKKNVEKENMNNNSNVDNVYWFFE